MAKRPDMQVVGGKLVHLRREKGLCAAAFAREIEQPLWLIMLLESAHMEQSRQLLDLVPDSIIDEVLQEIREVYGVSQRWLTTRYQSPQHPQIADAEPLPQPIFLPMAITPADAMTFLDDLMSLVMPETRSRISHDSFFRQSIRTVSLLYQMQLSYLQRNGHEALASEHRQQFQQLLDQRIAHWMQLLNITDLGLNDSPSA